MKWIDRKDRKKTRSPRLNNDDTWISVRTQLKNTPGYLIISICSFWSGIKGCFWLVKISRSFYSPKSQILFVNTSKFTLSASDKVTTSFYYSYFSSWFVQFISLLVKIITCLLLTVLWWVMRVLVGWGFIRLITRCCFGESNLQTNAESSW